MDEHRRKFLDFAFANGLKVFEDSQDDRSLKSGRISPWFLNVGEFNTGRTMVQLSEAYAQTILEARIEVDTLYGIPEKGVGLVGPVASELARLGKDVGWFFDRKLPKDHGEATGKSDFDLTKIIVGRVPKEGEAIGQLDDVFTAGNAKYEARERLDSWGKFSYPLLAIALDRQEVGIDGGNSIEKYEKTTGTKVVSVVRATDVSDYLKEQLRVAPDTDKEAISRKIERLSNYLRVYGTDEARRHVGKLEQSIFERDRSVIPACDVESIEEFEEIVKQTANIEGIGGYKIGFELGLTHSLPKIVEVARKHTNKPIIYDHQKAATDIPDTAKNFARTMKKAGVDAVILFPQAGPETERAWIHQAIDQGIKVIVGGRMTHPGYSVSEGGWITDEGALEMYRIAARIGIKDFVVPGNKPEVIKQIKNVVESEDVNNASYSAPGFVAQGGAISDGARVAGNRFNAIVGRGIYRATDKRVAAIEHTRHL